MKNFVIFVDKQVYRNRRMGFGGYQTITKRLEIIAQDISAACEEAIRRVGGGKVSMAWNIWPEK